MLLITPLLLFPLWSGMSAVCLLQLKGRRWSFGDFFAGFRHWPAFVGVGFLSQVLSVVVYAPGVLIMVVGLRFHNLPMVFVGAGVLLLGVAVLIFLQVRLLAFAPCIIFDRKEGAVGAIKANWELTRGHFWGLFGVGILLFLIILGGALACGIGALFAVPYAMLIWNAGYLFIAGRREPVDRPYISND
jgi:hypothetical protein